MKKKFLGAFLSVVMIMTFFATSFATVDFNSMIADLDGIIDRVEDLKGDYNQLLQDYSDVVDQLTPDTKNIALNLTNNISSETQLTANINQVKSELQALATPTSTALMSEIETMKTNAKSIADDGKDVIDELKANYSDLSAEQLNQVANKAKEAANAVGSTPDMTTEYNQLMIDINAVHTDLTGLNNDLNTTATTYEDEFLETATPRLARAILNKLIARDIEGALEEVRLALIGLGTSNGNAAASEINNLKSTAVGIKNDITSIAFSADANYLFFTDTQMDSIKTEIRDIADEYVDFAQYMIDTFAKPNYNAVLNDIYNYDVDTALDKVEDAIDLVLSYETRIETEINSIVNNPPRYLQMTALLGAGNYTTNDVKTFVNNNFQTQITDLKNTLLNEIDDYIQHLSDTMEADVDSIAANTSLSAAAKQNSIKVKNTEYLATRAKFEALRARIDSEIASRNINNSDLNSAINTATTTIYDLYNNTILNDIETNFGLEASLFRYDNVKKYIIANNFILPSNLEGLTGLATTNFEYNNLYNSKVKTTSNMIITLSANVFETYTFIVRADVNGDGRRNVSDVILTIDSALSLNDLGDVKKTAADMNSNGSINISDVIQVIDSVLGI